MKDALEAYLRIAAGHCEEVIEVDRGVAALELKAGGAAHLAAYVGHNGLMDFPLRPVSSTAKAEARSAIVLACVSKSYFHRHLRKAGAHPLLLTTGLMAPEAYTLVSAIEAWIEEGSTEAVVLAAAKDYSHYQECGLQAAQRLFWGAP